MSYSKEVLGFNVLESVDYIASGIAVSLEYKAKAIYIKPASSNDEVVGITLEEYVRGQANKKISVSVVAFSRALAGGIFNAGDLVGVNNNGEFIKSDDNIKPFAIALTDGYIGKYFQLLNINIKSSGGSSGGVSSVNGMDGDVVIEANNIHANVDVGMTQGEYNREVNAAFSVLEERINAKQNKLIADESIEIVDNKINEKVIVLPISVSGASIVEIANATATVIGRLLKLEASLGFSNTLTGRFQLNLIIDNVPSFVLADGLVSVSALNLNNMTMSALVANVSRSSSQMTVMILIDNISVYSRGMRIIQII